MSPRGLVPLLGTCGDTCAHACAIAEKHRTGTSASTVVLVVILSLFMVADAVIACLAILEAGRQRHEALVVVKAAVDHGPPSAVATTSLSRARSSV